MSVKFFKPVYLIDLYLGSSTVVAGITWFLLYFSVDHFFIQSFFPSLLLLGSYLCFVGSFHMAPVLTRRAYFPLLFLGQFLCLTISSIQFHILGLAYLAIIPCFAALIYFNWKDYIRSESGSNKDMTLIGITVSCYFLIYILGQSDFPNSNEVLFGSIFGVWGIGLIYLTSNFYNKSKSISLFSKKLSLGGHKRMTGERSADDRLFFHDVINQTHGLNLFLDRKMMTKESIDLDEMSGIKNEIKVLQSLIQDHFNLNHKNIMYQSQYSSFISIKEGLLKTIDSYLPGYKVEKYIIYNGYLDSKMPLTIQHKCLVIAPAVLRIVTNIVKNISEQKSEQVSFIFNYDSSGLTIISKNLLTKLGKDRKNLATNLSERILSHDKHVDYKNVSEGLGLKSINNLCKKLGGQFDFTIENEYWTSKVKLPPPVPKIIEEIEQELLDSKLAS